MNHDVLDAVAPHGAVYFGKGDLPHSSVSTLTAHDPLLARVTMDPSLAAVFARRRMASDVECEW